MKHIWSVLSKESTIDGNTNVLSIKEVIEELTITSPANIPQEPKIIPFNFEMVSFWIKGENEKDEKFTLSIEIYDPAGQKTNSFETKVEVPKEKERIRTRIRLQNFKFTEPGYYSLQVKNNNELVADIPLKINLRISEDKAAE